MVESTIELAVSHGFYYLNCALQVVQAQGKPQFTQVSVAKTLVKALACYATHFIVEIRPILLLASAVKDESDNLGIEFHAEENYNRGID